MIYIPSAVARRPAKMRRATTVTEMAFVLPVVMMLLIGTVDFAMVMYAYGTVSESARGGARYAMVHGSTSSSAVGPTANNATVDTQARLYAPALDSTQLTITSSWGSSSNDPGCPVTVTATYNCQLVAGRLVGLSSVTVSGTTTMLITH